MSHPLRALAALIPLLWLLVSAPLAMAQTRDEPLQLNLPAGSLAEALDRLGDQSGVQIMYEPALTKGVRVEAVSGTLTVSDALKRLLAQTGLRADRVNEKTVVLRRAEKVSSRRGSGESAQSRASEDSTPEPQEVVVSAQKRGEERLQDTPIPISVLSGATLTESNQVLLRDYYTSVPGLSVAPDIEAQQNIAIRGISQDGLNPTVAVLIDDIPFGSSTSYGGNTLPDIDPGDLARIEVLRGPQGTLYGAGSMGGIVKYVTKDPSTDEFSGRVEAGTNTVRNGAEPGFSLRASVNVPLGDTLAIRASAFTRQDAGYIDNIVQNIRGINEAEVFGARLASLWRPSDEVSLKLSALYQNFRGDGVPEVDRAVNGYAVQPAGTTGTPPAPPLGDLQQTYVAGIDRNYAVAQAYSASLKVKLGAVDFTSDTGYNISHTTSPFDFSPSFGSFFQSVYGVSGAPLITDVDVHKITEEMRLSGGIGDRVDWLFGGFYTHEDESPSFHQTIYISGATSGQIQGIFYNANAWPTYEEYAGFGDLTYHFTDRFDIQIGGRESHNHQTFRSVTTGAFVTDFDATTPPLIESGEASGNSFTYLLTPQFKVSPDLMVYARLASGYRPGGINTAPVSSIPPEYAPDKTYNYEVGTKGDFLDHKLSIDASAYYIDWRNLQVDLTTLYGYKANGSRAKSEGIELSAEGRPWTELTLSGWIDYDNAVLTANFPATSSAYGVSGDRLPFTAKFSAHLALQQDFALSSIATGFVGAEVSYVGDRVGVFITCANPGACSGPPPLRQDYPSYTKTDLRAGVKYNSWTTTVYATNVADVRGIISGGLGFYIPYAFTIIQPRTVGVTVSTTF